jgi:hypothetical protein
MTQLVLIQRLGLIIGFAIFASLAPSWLEGKSRPGVPHEKLAENLSTFPMKLGDWECVSEETLAPQVERTLKCYGYINRVYWNSKTGNRVTLALLFGPRGPMAVHTPEICYSSRGRLPVGKPSEEVPRGTVSGNSFWRLGFKLPQSGSSDIDVWYAWSDGGEWIASSYPRYWTTDRLFKIQLAGPSSPAGEESACESFLQHAVPAFRVCLEQ